MRRRACREGNHAFGTRTPIGAGLHRHQCKYCGVISIDLRMPDDAQAEGSAHEDDPVRAARPPALFRPGSRVTIFDIEQVVSAGLLNADDEAD